MPATVWITRVSGYDGGDRFEHMEGVYVSREVAVREATKGYARCEPHPKYGDQLIVHTASGQKLSITFSEHPVRS